MSEEEALIQIENIIYDENGERVNYIDIANIGYDTICEDFIQAIETLITAYEKKDKIIAEYNKRGQTLNNLMNAKDTYMYKEICKNFIPKDKIREIIEQLENKREQLGNFKSGIYIGGIYKIFLIIAAYKKLLEEE